MAKVLCLIDPRKDGTVKFNGQETHQFEQDELGNLVCEVGNPVDLAAMLRKKAHFRLLVSPESERAKAAAEAAEKARAEAEAKAREEADAKAIAEAEANAKAVADAAKAARKGGKG